ncbi:16S rRNA (cytidine(1402)-2'-O)-methyltransferase [Jeotgalibacillus proteolyticus]|uniref:Ribosomal RNA small subunit methyltransferase I n=1 Tax=Jeotgalibacillus proteolyticus TaxID=2082395 RepID=A0A2S5G6K8_9BACL|nr:16S rRNA (cytidine(1402)-2'-O)-methyltransferase [Jeotgalibacillus proteolyticus]PPA68564.1 16S rRNA (cytidine(1402)-2'-O)-methyltransferase [Jeotgalibacillus proteolyticus]
MSTQQSFNEMTEGRLYLVPTPIGNLEDMTFRAVRLLKEADVIAAEDTRNTRKLCNYFEISTPIISYHEHNKETSGEKVIERLLKGEQVALVSDAGMPCISDPGFELVRQALEEKINVVPLPGANAALTSLIASGLVPQPFYYYGFLSRGKKEKREELSFLSTIPATFVLYESPHRLKDTLKEMKEILGSQRKIVISRELTKKFEEFIRGSLEDGLAWAEENELRGEFCLIVEGAPFEEWNKTEEIWWEDLSIEQHVNHYIENDHLSSKAAIKEAAKDRGQSKRDIYQAYHVDNA